MKKIPIGIDDFRSLITENYFYIDKTKLIERIINDGALVKLFTRPRRFGKSLNMSMLRYFFDVKEAENNSKLFNNLYIKSSDVFKEQGQYPVIFMSMKNIKGTTWDEMQKSIRENLSNLYEKYNFITDKLNQRNKIKFNRIWYEDKDGNCSDAFGFLSDILQQQYDKKVIVLIDEYDAPLMSAYEYGYYDKASVFFKGLYGCVLKSMTSLKMGVLTGAVKVVQAGIFSDLNNLKINTVLNKDYDEYFGLSESEVENALEYYKLDCSMNNVRSWYNGYRFGNSHVYNPWSIINYIDSKELKAHWVNTSENILIKNLIKKADVFIFNKLEKLLNQQEQKVSISESIAFGKVTDANSIFELLLFSGYLTVSKKINHDIYSVKIPNKEVASFIKGIFASTVFKGSNNISSMLTALEEKDIKSIVSILEDVVLNAMSFYDTDRRYENPYQTLFTGFFYALDDYYKIHPNQESGYGRADIILVPRNKELAGYIIEIKSAVGSDLTREAQDAFAQINDKRYEAFLLNERIKQIVKIGLVFDSKKAFAYY